MNLYGHLIQSIVSAGFLKMCTALLASMHMSCVLQYYGISLKRESPLDLKFKISEEGSLDLKTLVKTYQNSILLKQMEVVSLLPW